MKFGVHLVGLGLRHLCEVAAAAEEHGFESVWVSDHVVVPVQVSSRYPYRADGKMSFAPNAAMYDPWVLLSWIAASTSRVRLGTFVYILPLRHPFLTARAAATLDRMSQGRLTLGIGVGWMREEFEATDAVFERRGASTDEAIGVLRRLWQEETVAHDGDNYRFPEVYFSPKPAQEPIPLEVGGTTKAALRRAGELGDGWLETGTRELADLAGMAKVVLAHRNESVRTGPFEMTTSYASDRDRALRCAELGFTRAIVRAPFDDRPTQQRYLEWMPEFADTVMQPVAAATR